jgi:hypothetical protein
LNEKGNFPDLSHIAFGGAVFDHEQFFAEPVLKAARSKFSSHYLSHSFASILHDLEEACLHQSLNLLPNPFAVNGLPYSVNRNVMFVVTFAASSLLDGSAAFG